MNQTNIKQNDSVSVVIPAYNAGSHIARAIDSVLAQSLPADEIIVVDDGSTDNTAAIVKNYGDKVSYIYQKNSGVSVARNTAIEASKGTWIALLDSDDEWLPDKLRQQMKLLKDHPELLWTTANYITCLSDEGRQQPWLNPDKAEKLLQGRQYFESFFEAFRSDAKGCTDTMLIRRDILKEAGGFVSGMLKGEDLDLWFRIAYRYRQIGYTSTPLAKYHLDTPTSAVRTLRGPQHYKTVEFIQRHIELARRYNQLDNFIPCARTILKRDIRSMLFEQRKDEITNILTTFDKLFSKRYKITIRLLTISPRLTAAACHTLSRIIRALHLRKRVVARPQRKLAN